VHPLTDDDIGCTKQSTAKFSGGVEVMQRISLACGWIVKGDLLDGWVDAMVGGDLLDGWVDAMVGGEDSRREPKLGKLFQMGKAAAISNRIVGGFDDAATNIKAKQIAGTAAAGTGEK
jgi:hypothetical protein